jgi:hypothetical protein
MLEHLAESRNAHDDERTAIGGTRAKQSCKVRPKETNRIGVSGYALRAMVETIRREGSLVRVELSHGGTEPEPIRPDLSEALSDPTVSLLIIEIGTPTGGANLRSVLTTVSEMAKSAGVRVEYRL